MGTADDNGWFLFPLGCELARLTECRNRREYPVFQIKCYRKVGTIDYYLLNDEAL